MDGSFPVDPIVPVVPASHAVDAGTDGADGPYLDMAGADWMDIHQLHVVRGNEQDRTISEMRARLDEQGLQLQRSQASLVEALAAASISGGPRPLSPRLRFYNDHRGDPDVRRRAYQIMESKGVYALFTPGMVRRVCPSVVRNVTDAMYADSMCAAPSRQV